MMLKRIYRLFASVVLAILGWIGLTTAAFFAFGSEAESAVTRLLLEEIYLVVIGLSILAYFGLIRTNLVKTE